MMNQASRNSAYRPDVIQIITGTGSATVRTNGPILEKINMAAVISNAPRTCRLAVFKCVPYML